MLRLRSLCAALVMGLLVALPAAADIVDRLDQKAPEVACTKWWNGKSPKIAKLGGVVLLHVHNPTKITSKAFEGKLKEWHGEQAGKSFQMIEILVDCTEADAQDYVDRSRATWLVGYDGKGSSAFAYPGNSVPRTYLIGPDGVVVWHAHIGALKDEFLDAQYARVGYYSKDVPRKCKALAKAARELRFGAAVKEADKLLANARATDEEKALAESVKAEVARYHALQMKVVRSLEKELDWGIVSRRVERMRTIYKGTDLADDVEKKWEQLEANPRVAYVAEKERLLDLIIDKTNTAKKGDVESALRELKSFVASYQNMKPAEKARRWITEYERLLGEM